MNDFMSYMMDDDTATANMQKLQEDQNQKSGNTSKLFFRYKEMPVGNSSIVRFLPISADVSINSARPDFWLPRKVVRLRFANPEQENSEVRITIPAMQMYVGGKTEDDLVLRQVRPLYDEADALEKKGQLERAKEIRSKASYHWTRGECLAQGFVVKSGLSENEADLSDNPIRAFELNKQLMNIIRATTKSNDPDVGLEYWPVHGKRGTDFVIKKTAAGEWPSYTTSCFSRRTSMWTDAQQDAIAAHGLWNLESFLPARPSEEEYQVLAEIMTASLSMSADGRIWNPDWEAGLRAVKVYKTNVVKTDDSDGDDESVQEKIHNAFNLVGSSKSETYTAMPDEDTSAEPVEEDVVVATKKEANSIIDKIKRTATKTAATD